jgi:CRISPR/Cas system-associated exonuclease Cas4 (RecB family)
MDQRERLRLLSLEMEMQRSWLAAYLDDKETRAAMRRRNVVLQLLMSAVRTRSLWIAGFGMAVEWWRQHKVRARAA